LKLIRDVEQMARRCGRNLCTMPVVSVKQRSPHACVDSQEKEP